LPKNKLFFLFFVKRFEKNGRYRNVLNLNVRQKKSNQMKKKTEKRKYLSKNFEKIYEIKVV